MDQLCVFLPNQLSNVVFLVTKHVVVRRDGRRIGHQSSHLIFVPVIHRTLLLNPFLLFEVLAGAWCLSFGTELAALETFDS